MIPNMGSVLFGLQLIVTASFMVQISQGLNPKCVEDVGLCKAVYLQNTTNTTGQHVWLTNKVPEDTDVFCSVNYVNFKACVKDFKDACRNETDTIFHAYDYLCDDANRKPWQDFHDCYARNYTEILECIEDFKGSWISSSVYTVKGEQVIEQCTMLKSYLRCVVNVVTETSCGEGNATWYSSFHRRSWRPFRDVITCDVYGPTGGTRGIVAGVVVAVITVIACFFCIWCRKKNKGVINSRTSTSL